MDEIRQTDQIQLPKLFEDEEVTAYKIHDHLYLFEAKKVLPSSIYILEGQEKTLVIDSGYIVADLPLRVSKVSSKPQILALTHGHHDHSGSIHQYDTIYMNKDDIKIIKKYNYQGKIIEVDEGFIFDLGKIHVQVIKFSGHTDGSIGFLDLEDRWIFTGDAIGSTCIWMQMTPEPLESLMGSIKKIESIKEKFDEIFIGHFKAINGPSNISYVEKMKNLLEKILYTNDFDAEPFNDGPCEENITVRSRLNGCEIVYNKNNIRYH